MTRKFLAVYVCLMLVVLSGSTVLAHPPGSITLKYDLPLQLLTIEVQHPVKDAGKHFVDKVEVSLNGKKVIEQKFMSQTDGKVQTVFYKLIDAKVGDTIEVAAGCNIAGNSKGTLEVTKPKPVKEGEKTEEMKEAEGGTE
jgi:desulfoferrodoxin (superoxide reductase-like protein)